MILLGAQNYASAQLRVKTGAYQGYEWNIFRNPESLIQQSDTLGRNQLWSNSSYNELFINTDYIKKWGNSRIKLSGDISGNIYHQQNSAQREFYKATASFRTKYASRKYFEFSPSFSRRKQPNIGQSDVIFRSRFSYYQVATPLNFDFYLKKQRWLKLETSYRYKAYDANGGEQTDYHSFSAQALYKKKWKGSIQRELELFAEWSTRNQTTMDFATATRPERITNRSFTTYRFGASLLFESVKKRFRIEFPVSYKMLSDTPSERLNYTQIEGGTKLSFFVKNVRVYQSFSATIRDFSNLTITDNELLNYNYIRSTTTVTIPFFNRFVYTVKGSLIRRLSNRNTITSSAFRGYLSSYIETGISINL